MVDTVDSKSAASTGVRVQVHSVDYTELNEYSQQMRRAE